MYKNILIPVALDHRPTLAAAASAAKKLLDDGGTITALNVMEPIPSYVSQYLPEDQTEKNLKDRHAELVAEMSDDTIKTHVMTGHAAQSILDYAQDHEVDLIVVASHDPGLRDYFLGSTAARVVRHAHCAVHVIR